MNVTTEQLAEILAGIARAQQAIIDAIDSDNTGWRNAHLLNKLNVAANLRITDARLIDLPSRVLLRQQSRVPMEPAQILRDLETALRNRGDAVTASATPAAAPAAGPAAKPSGAAPVPAPAKAPDDDLDFFNT